MPRQPRESPLERQLRDLGALQELDTSAREADVKDVMGSANMLKTLYDIQSGQQLNPYHQRLLQAQAQYYGDRATDLPEERAARAMELRLTGFAKAMYGREQTPEYFQGVKNIMSEFGYNIEPPAKPQKQEEFTQPTAAAKPPSAPILSATQPGYIPGLSKVLSNLPMETANLGAQIANYGYSPIHNLIASVTGTQPIGVIPQMTHYPTREEFAATSPDWLTNLVYGKKQPVQQSALAQ